MPTHVLNRTVVIPRRRSMPVWLPWLAAPAFLMLPIAGCGGAAAARRAAFARATPALPARPEAGKVAPVMTVVTVAASDPRVAAAAPGN